MSAWVNKVGTAEVCNTEEISPPIAGHVWFTSVPLDFVDIATTACGENWTGPATIYFVTDVDGAEFGEWSYEFTGINPEVVASNFSSTYLGNGTSGRIDCNVIYDYPVSCQVSEELNGYQAIYTPDFAGTMQIYFTLGENTYGPITLTVNGWAGPCEAY